MSCTTAPHTNHPWFASVTMKRKHSPTFTDIDSDELDSSSSSPPRAPKRPRARLPERNITSTKRKHSLTAVDEPEYTLPQKRARNLERDFADLSLSALNAVSASTSSTSSGMEIGPSSQYACPRPATPPVPEIRMHASSWYEPEPDRALISSTQSPFQLKYLLFRYRHCRHDS